MLIPALLFAVQATSTTPAATPAAACARVDDALPSNLAGWTTPAPSPATLDVGGAAILVAAPGAPDPKRPGNVATVGFKLVTAGRYAIALDQGAWIDVERVAPVAPLTSVTHRHGPDCTTIRKIVAFDLTPGDYRLIVRGVKGSAVKALLFAGE